MVAGNAASSTAESYIRSSNSWTTKTSLPGNRGQYYGFSLNDNLYFMGGNNGAAVSSGVKYNEIKNTMTTLSSSLLSAKMNGAGSLLNGFGYMAEAPLVLPLTINITTPQIPGLLKEILRRVKLTLVGVKHLVKFMSLLGTPQGLEPVVVRAIMTLLTRGVQSRLMASESSQKCRRYP
jgi:hypothetical protein